MDDLISRKAVRLALSEVDMPKSVIETEFYDVMSNVADRLIAVPSVDAAPVKHGRWEGDETCDAYDVAGVKTWAVKRKCSACGFVHKFIEAHMCYEFCPNCGAKMDLEG